MIYIYILVMAVTTYLIRMLPLTVFKKPIKSRFIRSFLHYVPVACLTAMTFPAILTVTESPVSGAVGLVVAAVLAFCRRSLILVAASSAAAVFITEQIIHLI